MMKIIGLGFLTLLFVFGLYLWKTEIGDDEIFILPDGYRGVVFILYNQENGEPVKYEQGKRVYEIPPGGILRTQFSQNPGWHSLGEYFYKQNEKLIVIPYVIDGRDVVSDRVQVCCTSTGKGAKSPNDEWIVFKQFYIGTKEDIDKASKKGEEMNPADLIN